MNQHLYLKISPHETVNIESVAENDKAPVTVLVFVLVSDTDIGFPVTATKDD
jgi:hypothetical protein